MKLFTQNLAWGQGSASVNAHCFRGSAIQFFHLFTLSIDAYVLCIEICCSPNREASRGPRKDGSFVTRETWGQIPRQSHLPRTLWLAFHQR